MSLTPLSQRIAAPASLPEPPDRDGLVWRAATRDDIDAIVGVYEAMADVDHPTWAETRDEIVDDLGSSWVDVALDTRIAFSGDRAVGFGEVSCQRTGETFERAGLPAKRWYFRLERALADAIPGLPAPEGLRFTPVTPDRWDEILEAKNAAFRDHWGSQPTSEEQWGRLMEQSSARHDLSLVALDGEERVVGLLTTLVIPEDIERQGYPSTYIQLIGVVRGWRRRGVAPALIASALRSARAAGFERTSLHVDADNPTGALRLYEGMGFVAVERSQSHILEFA